VNLDTPDRISVLDEMRLLHQRDGTDARTLLSMGTIYGAEALGLNSEAVTLRPGPLAGLLGVAISGRDPWESAMGGNRAPVVVFISRESF
jgi:cytosine/adenosine deaminase-related metal-dependent hydrolase